MSVVNRICDKRRAGGREGAEGGRKGSTNGVCGLEEGVCLSSLAATPSLGVGDVALD